MGSELTRPCECGRRMYANGPLWHCYTCDRTLPREVRPDPFNECLDDLNDVYQDLSGTDTGPIDPSMAVSSLTGQLGLVLGAIGLDHQGRPL